MLLFAAPDWPIGQAAPLILLIALALDAVCGDPRWLPHPVRLMGGLTALLDRTLNRERCGESGRLISARPPCCWWWARAPPPDGQSPSRLPRSAGAGSPSLHW